MKRYLKVVLVMMFMLGTSQMAIAGGEHGGKEHGGSAKKGSGHEQKGSGFVKNMKPSNEAIRAAMKAHVMMKAKETGTFNVKDPDTGKILNLSLEMVHERVGKTGDYYYSCADFKDVNTGQKYDLDIDVAAHGSMLKVADVRIHKVAGEPRYTYDDHDNRIPLMDTKSHLGTKGSGHDMKGSGKEHGGN